MEEIQRYNKEDLRATWAVPQWVKSLHNEDTRILWAL
jgi:predicted RecB family nuclease